jgi:hypothetical protein
LGQNGEIGSVLAIVDDGAQAVRSVFGPDDERRDDGVGDHRQSAGKGEGWVVTAAESSGGGGGGGDGVDRQLMVMVMAKLVLRVVLWGAERVEAERGGGGGGGGGGEKGWTRR